TATVTSSNTSNANAQGTGTIIDNDPVPSVSIADQTVTEGDTLVFTVMLSNPTYEDINLTIETADGTATTANNDYTPQTVTVLIPAGSISVTVSVPTTDDGVVENDENMTIAPTQVNSGTVDQMSGATGWILNDDVGPTATDDTVNGIAGQETVIHVVNNDSSGTSALDPTSVRIIDPNTGDMVTELVVPGEGRWVVDPVTGDITFEAEEGFTGDPAPIEYSVQDTAGNEDQAMITVDYPPVARDDNATGKLNEIITVNVLANDSNTSKPLDPLSVVITDENGTVIGSGKELIVPNEGIWTVNDDGTITFTPEENFPGCATPIHYTVSEENSIGPIDTSNPATVTVCYPPALDDVLNTQDQPGTAQTVNVLDNDAECIDPATVQIVDPDTNSLTDILVVAGEGTWTVDPSIGSITFTPQAGFEYDPTPIEYQAICENGQETKRATVTINYPLFARDDEKLDNDYGTPVILNDSLNDNGDLNTSSVELHLPDGFMDQHPDAVLSDDKKSLVVPGQGEWIVNDDGTITFVPEVGFEDDPTPIEYSVKNYSGAESNYAKLRVTYCDSPQKSDGGDAMGTISLLLMMMMTALIGLNFIRREESRGEK
ncbi:MAG: hypothetical protein IE885_07180, partial [Campylobacterales bacterium]|nr:hypothetical protein [Campylobacterales bacterium]